LSFQDFKTPVESAGNGAGRMKFGRKMMISAAVLVVGIATSLSAQTPGSGARGAVLSGARATLPAIEVPGIVREIDDPHLGTQWLLMRNPDHPGGPGRLVMVSGTRTVNQQRELGAWVSEPGTEPLLTVIRAGDRVIVEANSPVVEARLEAVALNPAAIGSPLDVRLKIGGKVLRAVALGVGRAALQAEPKVRP
jgi:hypothetical protein